MKRNVTITLSEEAARWARVEATRRDTSVSQLLGDWLEEQMRRDRRYETAMQAYLSAEPRRLKRRGGYSGRNELHERDRDR